LQLHPKLTAAIAILALAVWIKGKGVGYLSFLRQDDTPLRWSDEAPVSAEELPDERIYNEPHDYLINPVKLCQIDSSSLDYLFLILSATDHFEHRRAIRETWGKELLEFPGIRLAFLLGRPEGIELQSALISESLKHSDLIQGDFQDTYDNTTLKVVMMMHWVVHYCAHIKFLIRMDDDGVLNVPNFFKAIVMKPQNAIYGLLVHRYEIVRDPSHKNYYSEKENRRRFAPDFIAGAMMFLGSGTLKSLYKGTGQVRPFRGDDSYLAGKVAERVGVPLAHQEGIHYFKLNSTCELKSSIYVQDMPPAQMREVWYELQRTMYTCLKLVFHFHFCFCTTLEKPDGNGDSLLL
ncbi:unnamed protein product, partial [Ixodes hexagonus]